MPETSRKAWSFSRRSLKWAGGFALKVEDIELTSGADNLAQMIVAVNTDFVPVGGGLSELLEPL